MIQHGAQEMKHLAPFLSEPYRDFRDTPRRVDRPVDLEHRAAVLRHPEQRRSLKASLCVSTPVSRIAGRVRDARHWRSVAFRRDEGAIRGDDKVGLSPDDCTGFDSIAAAEQADRSLARQRPDRHR
jgi:hypothetical protein